jgi:high-affinity iron transporter
MTTLYKFINRREEKMGKMKGLYWVVIIGSFLILSSLGTVLGKDPAPPKKTPDLMSKGKKIFEQTCTPCHGSKGDGKGPAGAVLKPPPTDFTKPLKEWPYTKGNLSKVFEVITKGIPNTGMVAWTQYSEQERWALAYTTIGFSAQPAKKGK